jgi:hypothetical protein
MSSMERLDVGQSFTSPSNVVTRVTVTNSM